MKAFELFFVYGPSIQCLFRLGMLPQNVDFIELNEEERCLYFKQNKHSDEKVYKIKLSCNDERYKEDIICVTETEKEILLKAVDFINDYGKDKIFSTVEDKLHYAAS